MISIRGNIDTISIWNKNGRDHDIINQIRQDIIRVLGIPSTAQMNYEPFNVSDEDKEQILQQSQAAI